MDDDEDLKTLDRGDDLPPEQDDPKAEDPPKDEPKGEEKDEPKDEPKQEPKGETKDEPKDEPKGESKGIMIPKSRFDELNRQRKADAEAAEARVRELEAELAKAKQEKKDDASDAIEKDLDDLERARSKALKDGDDEEAAKIGKIIRTKERELARAESKAEAATLAAAAKEEAIERVRFEAAVSAYEAQYPQLNPDDEDNYDKALVEELLEWKAFYEAKKLGSTESLHRAIQKMSSQLKPAQRATKAEVEAQKEAERRKEEAVKRGLDTKGKQPADVKSGLDSDKAGGTPEKNVMKISDEDFAALPESTRARMRGDFL